MKIQRLRFRYRVTAAASDLRHRDVTDAWEAALRAAELPVAFSEGKRATAQISLGAPLPQGATSDWELIDVFFAERMDPRKVLCALPSHFPAGIEPVAVEELGVAGPSLQSQLRWAEYTADVPAGDRSEAEVREAIAQTLTARTLPAEYRRETKVRHYDLRPLILDLRLDGSSDGHFKLRMKLRAEPENTARADQTVLALGLPVPSHIHRVHLHTEDIPAGIAAYRRAGSPARVT